MQLRVNLQFYQRILQYQMDLLVQQKIQAAMQPLFEKINSLEEQLKKMALQIQTIQNENQLKLNSQLAHSIQIQTQQTRLEHRLGTDRLKVNKHPVTDKMNNKKENTGAKAQPKMETPQIHGTKKEVKRQPTKSFKANPKDNKTQSHLPAQKPKKTLEQRQSQKMMKQPAEEMLQKVKNEVFQPSSQKMNDMNTIQGAKQKADQNTQNHTDLNQIKENIQMMPEIHQIETSAKESTNLLQEQEEMLIPFQNNEEVNIVIMPSTLAESIVYEVENSIEPQSQSPQNQKVDSKIQKNQKEEPKESHTREHQAQHKIKTSQTPQIMPQMQSPQKQEHKPAAKPMKEQKVLSNLLSKKQTGYRKKTEENREKVNKSMIIHKQKNQTKPRKDTVKESNIKQKNVGKSVDPAKKIKAKEDPKTEKKPSEATKTENVLNEQDTMKAKQEVQKQNEENLLAQTKADIQA